MIAEVERSQDDERLQQRALPVCDATALVGLKTTIYDVAVEYTDDEGGKGLGFPKVSELMASAAVARCLMPLGLRGHELTAIREIVNLTVHDFAKKLDEHTAAETVAAWESEAQPMSSYAEKLLRLFVCEKLTRRAPGSRYNASTIVHLSIADPWRSDPTYEVPPIELWLLPLVEQSGDIIEAWVQKKQLCRRSALS